MPLSKETKINQNRNNIRRNKKTTHVKPRKPKWEVKQLYGYFKRQTKDITHELTWTWLRRGNLKRETETEIKYLITLFANIEIWYKRNIRQGMTVWERESTGNCARDESLAMLTNSICSNQNLSKKM